MFLQKGHSPNWSEEVFVIKTVENTGPWAMGHVINDLNVQEIFLQKRIAENKPKRV